jgi:hypothetical protein
MHRDLNEAIRLVAVQPSDHPYFRNERCRKLTLQVQDEFDVPVLTCVSYVDESLTDEEYGEIAKRHLLDICTLLGRQAEEPSSLLIAQ